MINTTQTEVIGSSFQSNIEPTDIKTDFILDGHMTNGFTDLLNDNSDGIEDSAGQFLASAHFTVHSFEKYWEDQYLLGVLTTLQVFHLKELALK